MLNEKVKILVGTRLVLGLEGRIETLVYHVILQIIFPTVIILMIAKIVEAVSFALEPPIRLSLHTYPGPAVMLPNAFSKDPLYPLYEVFVEEYGGYIIQAVDSNMTQG